MQLTIVSPMAKREPETASQLANYGGLLYGLIEKAQLDEVLKFSGSGQEVKKKLIK